MQEAAHQTCSNNNERSTVCYIIDIGAGSSTPDLQQQQREIYSLLYYRYWCRKQHTRPATTTTTRSTVCYIIDIGAGSSTPDLQQQQREIYSLLYYRYYRYFVLFITVNQFITYKQNIHHWSQIIQLFKKKKIW